MDRNHDSVQKASDRAVKIEDIKSKERMNKDNNKTALANPVSGETKKKK